MKLELLCNCIETCALTDAPERDFLTARFIRWIDELEPEHFVALAYIGATTRAADPHPQSKGPALRTPPGMSPETWTFVLRDLTDRGLVLSEIDPRVGGEAPLHQARTVPLAEQLLRWVQLMGA